jgi:hypothetical protein
MTSAASAGSNRNKPPAEIAGQILDPAHDKGAKITGEIADRIDGGDAWRNGRAGKKGRRQGP